VRASFARRMLQYVPLPPATSFLVSASGVSTTSAMVGTAIGGVAPVWASTPSISVTATVSGYQAFSFTGGAPTSVVVEPGDTLPAYFTLSLTGISWSGSSTAGATFSFRLRASNVNGYSTSGVISGTVAAAPASTGFFAGYTILRAALNFGAQENDKGFGPQTKQTGWAPHPNGRLYLFGGDFSPSGAGLPSTNYACQIQYSLNLATITSAGKETGWRLEHPYYPTPGYAFPVHEDCNQVAFDTRRRVFWQTSGFNFPFSGTTPPAYDSPGGVGFVTTVGKFDPSLPLGQRWINTGVGYLPSSLFPNGGSETERPSFYDPLLDVIWGGRNGAPQTFSDGCVKIFDPAGPAWLGKVRFDSIPNLQPPYNVTTVGLDEVNRLLYLAARYEIKPDYLSPIGTVYLHFYKVTIPTTRASLPVAGTGVDWSANATLVWSNPQPTVLKAVGGVGIRDGATHKYYSWLLGPIGTENGADGGWTAQGYAGHPARGNGSFGSSNTGFLVDLNSGAFEYTQFPHMTYDDGQGWILPNVTQWDAKSRRLVYGTADFEEVATGGGGFLRREQNLLVARKSQPSWVPSASNTWTQIPNSQASVNFTGADRTLYTGAEPAGRANELNADGQNPWFYSSGTIKQAGSVLLFHGGGGLAGRSNAILAFHANEETPYWSLPMPPTPKSLTIDDGAWAAGGGGFANWTWEFNHRYDNNLTESSFPTVGGQPTPVAVHTYSAAQYLDSEGLWLRFSTQMVHPNDGAPVFANGQGRNASVHGFAWSETSKAVADRRWLINAKANGIELESGQVANRNYAKHPWTEDVVGGSSGRIHWWKRASNTWQARVDGFALPSDYNTVGIEPANNLVLLVNGSAAPYCIDLDAATPSAQAGSWTGATFAGAIKWTWDDDNACFWALTSGFDLFKVTLANKATRQWTVTAVSTLGTKPTTYKPEEGMTFAWSRELGGLLFSPSYSRPIWFLRTAARA